MNKKEYRKAREAMAAILKEYDITSDEEFDSMDEETGAVLYEALKAGILEEFDISEDEMGDILNELIESASEG